MIYSFKSQRKGARQSAKTVAPLVRRFDPIGRASLGINKAFRALQPAQTAVRWRYFNDISS
jgi:hypothetical protein